MPQRDFRRSQNDGASGRTILHGLQHTEQQSLARGGKQVDAIEKDESRQHRWISFRHEPLARVVTLKGRLRQDRSAMQEAGQGLFSRPAFAFDGSQLQVGRYHLGLQKKLPPT